MRQSRGHYDLDISWILWLPWTGSADAPGPAGLDVNRCGQVTAYGG